MPHSFKTPLSTQPNTVLAPLIAPMIAIGVATLLLVTPGAKTASADDGVKAARASAVNAARRAELYMIQKGYTQAPRTQPMTRPTLVPEKTPETRPGRLQRGGQDS